eukprot:scaffold52199_cov56-Attheya_sp.AAC.4
MATTRFGVIGLIYLVLLSDLEVVGACFSIGTKSPASRLFLDTAVESEWYELLPLGIFHGITTNPTLLERAKQPCTVSNIQRMAHRALNHPNCQEFMCQAWGETAQELYETGLQLATNIPTKDKVPITTTRVVNDQVVIKVPVTAEGTKAASMLIQSNVRVCLTACYASHQALIAASVGAEYLAPYLGRMDDAGKDGADEIVTMQQIVDSFAAHRDDNKGTNDNNNEETSVRRTRIFVASIRSVSSMVELATKGLDTFTFSPDIARALFNSEPLTLQAANDFELAAKRGSGETTQINAPPSPQ